MLKTREKTSEISRFHPLRGRERVQTRVARSTTLDWQVLDEDEPWNGQVAMPDSARSDVSPARGRIRSLRAIAGLLVVLVMGAALYLWRTAESGAQLLEDELRATVAAEQRFSSPSRAGQDGHDLPAPAATVQAQEITFHGDVASVQVETTHAEPDGRTYSSRQRQFYQSTAAGWVRVPPTSADFGSLQNHETEFFIFFYHRMDGAAVEAVAAELDAIYAGLRQDYGLPPAVERVVVELVIDLPSATMDCHRPNQLCIQSPALAALPADLSETEALQLWVLNALVNQVRSDAIEKGPFQYDWQYATYVLPRMQMRRHSDLLSAWQTELVQWLYRIEARAPKPDEEMLAQELARLCDTHQILARQTLFAVAVPTGLCLAPPMLDLRYLAKYKPPDRLGQLYLPDPDRVVTDVSWVRVLTFDTLLDYAVATYGNDALPALVEGFRRYNSWSTLIPAVFDISAEEFERGWQGYLLTLR
jgi:hypothetical protein